MTGPGALALLWTGLGWVDATRAAVRSMWRLDDAPGNFVTRKLVDLAALAGLGTILVISWGSTVMVDAVTDQVLDWIGVGSEPGRWVSRGVALGLAIVTSSVRGVRGAARPARLDLPGDEAADAAGSVHRRVGCGSPRSAVTDPQSP